MKEERWKKRSVLLSLLVLVVMLVLSSKFVVLGIYKRRILGGWEVQSLRWA